MPATSMFCSSIRHRSWTELWVVLGLCFASCSQIATVKHHEAAFVASGSSELSGAENALVRARTSEHDPLRSLGGYLAAADDAAKVLKRDPRNPAALHTYNYAVGRCVELVSD